MMCSVMVDKSIETRKIFHLFCLGRISFGFFWNDGGGGVEWDSDGMAM